MTDHISKVHRELLKSHDCAHSLSGVHHSVRPPLLANRFGFLSEIFSIYFNRTNKNSFPDSQNGRESTSDYISRLSVWMLIIIFALFSAAIQIFFILAYIYEY